MTALYFPLGDIQYAMDADFEADFNPPLTPDEELRCGSCVSTIDEEDAMAHQCFASAQDTRIGIICRKCFDEGNTFECCSEPKEVNWPYDAEPYIRNKHYFLSDFLIGSYFQENMQKALPCEVFMRAPPEVVMDRILWGFIPQEEINQIFAENSMEDVNSYIELYRDGFQLAYENLGMQIDLRVDETRSREDLYDRLTENYARLIGVLMKKACEYDERFFALKLFQEELPCLSDLSIERLGSIYLQHTDEEGLLELCDLLREWHRDIPFTRFLVKGLEQNDIGASGEQEIFIFIQSNLDQIEVQPVLEKAIEKHRTNFISKLLFIAEGNGKLSGDMITNLINCAAAANFPETVDELLEYCEYLSDDHLFELRLLPTKYPVSALPLANFFIQEGFNAVGR